MEIYTDCNGQSIEDGPYLILGSSHYFLIQGNRVTSSINPRLSDSLEQRLASQLTRVCNVQQEAWLLRQAADEISDLSAEQLMDAHIQGPDAQDLRFTADWLEGIKV
jgi:hypothetical protein